MNPGFIETITKKPEPPERIYGWMNSQLSISRHYGGCTYQGARYHIAPNEEGQPLVRADEFVNLRESTAAMSKRRGASLIEYTLAFMAMNEIHITEAS